MKPVQGFDPSILRRKLIVKEITTDMSHLSKDQKKLTDKLIECAKILDDIFYLQKYPDGLTIRDELSKTDNEALKLFYRVMSGPLDHFNEDRPFLEGFDKIEQGGFYPVNLTKKELEEFLESHPAEKEAFTSPYTIITSSENGLTAVNYSDHYKTFLLRASAILKEAAELTDNYSLNSYLSAQANAFLNNDFREADIRWVQLRDNDIIPLLGPYEFYEDRFLGYKAAFSGSIGLKNKEEFVKLNAILGLLDKLQARLPIPEHYRKQKRGSISQIEIVNIIYNSGDSRSPVPTAAYNLPNSQKIRAEFGSRKVLLYNIMEAKFNAVMLPIAGMIMDENDGEKVTFGAYFNYILLHEISHELGIGFIKDSKGRMRELSFVLKELYSIIEEAKADVMGMFSLIYLLKKGHLHDCSFTEICATYLTNLLRLIRFGLNNSHGVASLIQLNFLVEEEIIVSKDEGRKISVDFHRFERAIEKLLTFILTFQGEGDYNKTKSFIDQYSKISKDIEAHLETIASIPIDILPWYPAAGEKEPFTV
jgi:hypothetical protein